MLCHADDLFDAKADPPLRMTSSLTRVTYLQLHAEIRLVYAIAVTKGTWNNDVRANTIEQ